MNQRVLFEISWEVCNKVGGIHTVISSKSKEAVKKFENYFCVGPYRKEKQTEFVELELPTEFRIINENLKSKGIKIHYGIWEISGRPKTILIEYLDHSNNLNNIKTKLWDEYKIDSLNSQWFDTDEVLLWSWCCGIAIEEISKLYENTLMHAHEWLSCGAIFYSKIQKNNIKTIFTTHATMLGRALVGNRIRLYEHIGEISANEKAYELGIQTKHQIETVAANICDCFTTVSEITALEATKFYNKKPDKILCNGFNVDDFQEENIVQTYKESRKEIEEYIKKYFHNSYHINIDKTLVFFTSGRFEFISKGIDILIDALTKLNQKLKNEKSDLTVVVPFFLIIGNFEKDKEQVLSFADYLHNKKSEIQKEFAPLSTHLIPTENECIQKLFQNGLCNKKSDKVKVILSPVMLDSKDGFFNKDYYRITNGCDLGIFPSYYEPWGYTPLESITLGVPTVTSNLAGFGNYSSKKLKKDESIYVLDRKNQTYEESTDELFKFMLKFINLDLKKKHELKYNALETAKNFTWRKFYENYLKAYEIAQNK